MGADTRSRLLTYATTRRHLDEVTEAQARKVRVLGSRMSPPKTLTA